MARRPYSNLGGTRSTRRAFTLIELILVMALLAIVAVVAAPRLSGFFRGRSLDNEATRLQAVLHYAQSQAIAEGVPVLLWIDTAKNSYGIKAELSFDEQADNLTRYYTAESDLSLEVDAIGEDFAQDMIGLPEGCTGIRFTPEGYIGEGSVSKIVIRQEGGHALQLVLNSTQLAYDIEAVTDETAK